VRDPARWRPSRQEPGPWPSRSQEPERIAPDGEQIGPGLLTGALTEADAEEVVILGMTLKEFLVGGEPPILPDLDLDEDGTKDAWQFEGCFTAVPVTLVP
jgi:hypothetical protein